MKVGKTDIYFDRGLPASQCKFYPRLGRPTLVNMFNSVTAAVAVLCGLASPLTINLG